MRRTTLATVALIPACALALTACGSQKAGASAGASVSVAQDAGQNNAHLTQAQLLARFKTALGSATALHMKGSMSDDSSGQTVTTSMDIQINKGGTGQGTISEGGMTMPVISIGSTSYVQATSSYVSLLKQGSSMAGADPALAAFYTQLTVGKWLKYTGTGAADAGFGSMLDFSQMTTQLADNKSDTFTYLGTGTLDGQQVAQYKDHSTDGSSPDATMSIPLTGSPLPLQEDAGKQGKMTFTWNQPTTVTAPPANEIINVPAALMGDDSSSGSASVAPSAVAS